MRQIYKYALALVCMVLVTTSFTSCEWDTSPEPDHPMYVTYTITAENATFDGPEELLNEINAWIKANSIIYDAQVNYTTGEASEFTNSDAEAAKKYENEFVPRFQAYLNEVNSKLASGLYGNGVVVRAVFYTYAKRAQGKQGDLKYDQFELVYPPVRTNG